MVTSCLGRCLRNDEMGTESSMTKNLHTHWHRSEADETNGLGSYGVLSTKTNQ